MKAIMVVAGLIAIGALTDALQADDLAERRVDLIVSVVAALALGLAAAVERSRTGQRGD